MAENSNYDDLLYPILHHQGNIVGFFDAIFDFLYRRTDYFSINEDPLVNFGFPKGAAENIVRNAFCKYMKMALENQNKTSSPFLDEPPEYVAEETVTSTTEICSPEPVENRKVVKRQRHNSEEQNSSILKSGPADASEDKVYQNYAETYNGGVCDNYCWSQTIKDVDIHVTIPPEVQTGKHVKVSFSPQHLKVEVYDSESWKVLVDGDLHSIINVEESAWTLVPFEHIHICLEKRDNKWWNCCLTDEPKIDLQGIDATQPYEELDEESQEKIRELMYREHQKRLGKPVVQNSKMHDVLKEAWNKEDSPFKGQPYDPSFINFVDSDGCT